MSDQHIYRDFPWNDRNTPTPKGRKIWVTDGDEIWMLTGDGAVFPDRATACKFWCIAVLPNMPSGERPEKITD